MVKGRPAARNRWRGPESAIDALIVAVADLAGGAVVATADRADLGLVAGYVSNVVVADISA